MIQFGRQAQLALITPNSNTAVTLRTVFNIEKEMTAQGASKAEIKVYNMSAKHVQMAEQVGQNLKVVLSAGYNFGGVNNVKQLFVGLVNYMTNDRTGPELVTTFEFLPGAVQLGNVFVNVVAATSDWDVYRLIVNACQPYGITTSPPSARIQQLLQSGVYNRPWSECGTAAKLMDMICRRHYLRWSPNDNDLNLYSRDEFEASTVVNLSAPSAQFPNGTGLVGIPSKMQDANYKIKALLNPDIQPGSQLVVTSPLAGLNNNSFKVWKATYEGDTLKGPWYVEAECSLLGKSPTFAVDSGT